MSIAKLLSHLSGLSPQARYALMKMWLENGHSLPLRMSVQDCARHMAIPRARAGKVINELIDAGHIEPDYRIGQRGRPKLFIDISAATTEMLRNLTPTNPGDVLHLESVHRLLTHRTSDADADADSPSLSPANLVFLIALLSCANECGAVHDLGTARLNTYTGMTAQRINLQISKMRRLGVLLSTVPGITSGRILGRTTTTYWLNLNHHLLKGPDHPMIVKRTLVMLESGDIVNELFELIRVFKVEKRQYMKKSGRRFSNRQAAELASKKLNDHLIMKIPKLDICLVEDFFGEVENPGLRLAFQSMVDQVAGDRALARISAKQTNGKISLTTSMLRYLYQELLPLHSQRNDATDFPTRKNKQMLMRLALYLAKTLADELTALLPHLELAISEITSLELAPTSRKPSKDRQLIVASSPAEGKQQTKIEKLNGGDENDT